MGGAWETLEDVTAIDRGAFVEWLRGARAGTALGLGRAVRAAP